MANFPGPFEVRIFQTGPISVGSRGHVHNFNCNINPDLGPGLAFSAYDVILRTGSAQKLDAYVDFYVGLMRPLFSSGTTIDRAELWKYVPGTNNAAFYSTYDIALVGSGGSLQPDSELIMTYRTLGGGSMRQTFLDTVFTTAVSDGPPYANAPVETLRLFTLSDANAALGRDNTMPFSAVGAYHGVNERLFKQRLRP